MRNVAEAAGVSVGTVSRALRDEAGISAPVRERVAAVAEQLGYDRHRRVRSRVDAVPEGGALVMVVAIELFTSDAGAFYRSIIDGIEDEADRRGLPLETVLIGAGGAARLPRCGPGPTGVLLVGIDAPDLVAEAAARFSAAILVNGQDPAMRIDGVAPANRRGAYLAAMHLLGLGHRRIAHVTALRRQTIRDRLDGYRAALAAAGVVEGPGLLIDLPQLHPEAAVEAMRNRLANGPLDATALFCANDIVAAGCISALSEAGLRVPDDISVIGFDNTRATLRIQPALTTIAIDTAEIARCAVARLLERLNTPDLTQSDVAVGCTLITRASTAAPKDAP